MKKRRSKKSAIAPLLALLVPVIWIALKIAPYSAGGIPSILEHANEITAGSLFDITICPETAKTLGVCLLLYTIVALCYVESIKNYRHGEEHGSAQWGDARSLSKKYAQKPPESNRILTQNVRIGLNGYKHRRNLNTIVLGGSGTGKSLFYAIPNLMQANTSVVVPDPKGELLRKCGNYLESVGFDIVVLDLIHMEKSFGYNPFEYLKSENDVQKLVTNFFQATGPKNGAGNQDKFWDDTAQMYLKSLIFFLLETAPKEEQNFTTVGVLINYDTVADDDMMGSDSAPSPIQELMWRLEGTNPDSLAVKYYNDTHSAAGKTMKSIQITLHARLDKFNLHEVQQLTKVDEMHIGDLGVKKKALFCVIPDNDTSFNFLVSMLYTQIFQTLFRIADDEYHGSLPVPVHFLMDEFANIALPDDFEKILSVMRSRNVSVSIILQTMSQLKTLYKDNWETIVGNCDEMVFLGGNEASTTKYLSERLGKETIDSNTFGKTRGRNGSYSTNYQIGGRELMMPDEIAQMDNDYALVFIRGERPVYDRKFDPSQHPAASKIAGLDYQKGFSKHRSSAKPFCYGEPTLSTGSLICSTIQKLNHSEKSPDSLIKDESGDFLFLDGDEILKGFTEENNDERT